MNLFALVWNYAKARPLNTALNILLLAISIAVMTVLLIFNRQLQEKLTSNSRGIDLVVGAKGSPLQLILCNLFQIDYPTGNIKLSEAEKIVKHRMVKQAIPLALGDSYNGYRIVGTRPDYATIFSAELATGKWWNKDLEVNLGAVAAELTGLKPGDTFVSAHGLTSDGHNHDQLKYVVTGILKKNNTVIDNLILTNIESIWKVHGLDNDSTKRMPLHPSSLVPGVEEGDSIREITSILIQYRNPIAIIQLPRFVNSNSKLQAAAPAFETARLFSILGVGANLLRAFAYVILVVSGLSIFIALYNSLKERRYDLAIMRSMGASRRTLFVWIVIEGTFLTVAGSLIGLAMGHGVFWIFTLFFEESQKAGFTPGVFYFEESAIVAGSMVMGFVCSLLPAIQAYQTDIHKVLSGN